MVGLGCLMLGCLIVQAGCARPPVETPADRLMAAGPVANELLLQTRQLTNAGRYAGALGTVDSLLRVAPELPEAYYQRGNILMQLYQLPAADTAYARTIALDPYHRGGWYKRGHVAFEQGRYREAIQHYGRQREVIRSSPKALREYYRQTDQTALPQTWLQSGRAHQLLHQSDSARWAY
jgi:tetratricopeptide (TPR) repeat protein